MNNPIVTGPFFTHAGFKAWFLVCFPQSIVAVPMGFWFSLTSNKAMAPFLGGAVGAAIGNSGGSRHADAVRRLSASTENSLRGDTRNVVYPLSHLASITYKAKRLSSSEIVVAARSGAKRVFGIINAEDQGVIIDSLKSIYGAKVRLQ
jgi:hypothetical protein